MRLILVRHAESTWNATGRWQGQSDVPLSPRGRLQARSLAARLFGAEFDHRLCSDLSRAVETAEALGTPAVEDSRLREIDVGQWAGLARSDVATRFPEQVAGLRRGEPVRIGGGESMAEFEARVDDLVDEMGRTYAGQQVLAVTHGGVIRALSTRVLGARARTSPLTGVSNTSLTVFAQRERLVLEVYNDRLHIDTGERDSSTMRLPEPGLRLALVAAEPSAAADSGRADVGLVDPLLTWLGMPQIYCVGAARDALLSEQLLADPVDGAAELLTRRLRDEQVDGSFAIVALPDEVRALTAQIAGLDVEGLAVPAHGSVVHLRLVAAGAMLCSYGVHVGRAHELP